MPFAVPPIPGSPWLIERFPVRVPVVAPIPFSRCNVLLQCRVSVTCLGFAGRSGWDVEYELRDVRFFFKDARMLLGREATFDTLRCGAVRCPASRRGHALRCPDAVVRIVPCFRMANHRTEAGRCR